MSLPSIVSTQSPSVSGLYVNRYGHYKKESSLAKPSTPAASTDSGSAEPLASAIAAALTQLGLIPNANTADSENAATTGNESIDALSLSKSASPHIQQYRSMASASSSLAQALSASANSTSQTSRGDGQLTSVFQSLWTSLGASSGMSASAPSDGTMPSLQSFMETLARHFSQSGISGLRGVFVDTVA
ncbi:hypothetical protein [Dyella sp. 2HG41-7]|uniref:hypothetical protein n=1 Tax=Dyella sp. 2HG41-7 TaxID=2883239 RepID=UPI001F43608E|nr:hypothetical protein [Dyella sp. 2HG41-7]